MKKIISLDGEIKRMKSLMTEERLYGSLVNSPIINTIPNKKIITEGWPGWKAIWLAFRSGAKETPELITTILSKSYIAKVNKVLNNIPKDGKITAQQSEEIITIAKGLAHDQSVAENVTKLIKSVDIDLSGGNIAEMKNMFINLQAVILKGVAYGDNALQIAVDLNKITGSKAWGAADVTDFAHFAFDSPSVNKILRGSDLSTALKGLTKADKKALWETISEMPYIDYKKIFKETAEAIPFDDPSVLKKWEKILKDALGRLPGVKTYNFLVTTAVKTGKTLLWRFDIPPLTRLIESTAWGKSMLSSPIMTGGGKIWRVKLPSLANTPAIAGIGACAWKTGIPYYKSVQDKFFGDGIGDFEQDKAGVAEAITNCISDYLTVAPKVIPKGIFYVVSPFWEYELNLYRNNLKKYIIEKVCKDAGEMKIIDGKLSCNWDAIQERYPDCESLKGPNGAIETFKNDAIDEKWYHKLIDFGLRKLTIEEEVAEFKDQVAEQLTNWPGLCDWFEENLHLKWEFSQSDVENKVNVEITTGDTKEELAAQLIINDMMIEFKKTGIECQWLKIWKDTIVDEDKVHTVENFDNGKDGFKTWFCGINYGLNTEHGDKPIYIEYCKKAVDKWCP